jgi:hypothetical protein
MTNRTAAIRHVRYGRPSPPTEIAAPAITDLNVHRVSRLTKSADGSQVMREATKLALTGNGLLMEGSPASAVIAHKTCR